MELDNISLVQQQKNSQRFRTSFSLLAQQSNFLLKHLKFAICAQEYSSTAVCHYLKKKKKSLNTRFVEINILMLFH